MVRTARLRPQPPLPLTLRWDGPANPLPLRPVRLPARSRPRPVGREAPPWLDPGPAGRPFDFCGHVRRLCADVVRHTDALRHIDVSRLLFAGLQARSARPHGLQARVTPLRCRGGALTRRRNGRTYQVQRFFHDGREMLRLLLECWGHQVQAAGDLPVVNGDGERTEALLGDCGSDVGDNGRRPRCAPAAAWPSLRRHPDRRGVVPRHGRSGCRAGGDRP